MPKIEEHPRQDVREPAPTSRKEDYKAYTERDVEEGWPYSDEPGREEDRLERNRPYAAEMNPEAGGPDAEHRGFHVEEAPLAPEDAILIGDLEDEGGDPEDDGGETPDRGAKPDESADPEVDPKPR